MTVKQFEQVMTGMKLLAVEMQATRQLVIDAIADMSDLEARIAAVGDRFDE